MGVRHGIIAVANVAAMVAFACTNDYGKLDFSGGLDGSAGTADAGGGASASGGTGGNPNTGGSSGSSGTGGGGVDSGMDSSAGGIGGTGGTSGSGGIAGAGGGGSGGTAPDSGGGGTAPEAGVPEAGTPSCDQLYGGATGYIFCSEDATSCTFYATTSSTCDALCTGLGGTCIAANDNSIPPGQECSASSAITCTTSRTDAICTCSRP